MMKKIMFFPVYVLSVVIVGVFIFLKTPSGQQHVPAGQILQSPSISSKAAETKATYPDTAPSGLPVAKMPTNTPIQQAITDNRCIITIYGVKYDLIQFRAMHSGGDIFKCGTDMTSEFAARHGQRELDILSAYKI